MKEQLKLAAAIGAVLLLLPCVLTVFLSGPGAITFFGKMDLEGYVAAGTCLAVPFDGEEEMLKAQAVMIRSRIVDRKMRNVLRGEELKRIAKQIRKARAHPGFERKYQRCRKAAMETKGEILWWKGGVCPGAFHYISGGKTRDGCGVMQEERYGYLESVESPWDIQAPEYFQEKIYTAEELSEKWKGILKTSVSREDLEGIQVARADDSGYVTELQIGEKTIPGETAADALGLPSCCFSMQAMEGRLHIFCHGSGHGFGLSQYGAQRMAKEGADYREILHVYFPSVKMHVSSGFEKKGV